MYNTIWHQKGGGGWGRGRHLCFCRNTNSTCRLFYCTDFHENREINYISYVLQDVVDTHPGLTFLLEAPEFHSRYVNTVSIHSNFQGHFGFTVLCRIFSLFLHENVCCGYSLEAPWQGASNDYPQHIFLWRNKKTITIFQAREDKHHLMWSWMQVMQDNILLIFSWKYFVGNLLVSTLGNILSWRFDHEIFLTVILSLPLVQEGQLSVSGKRMCTILVNCLED